MIDFPNRNERIAPENELENRIISSEVFKMATSFQSQGKGHPEKEVYKHISLILNFIDEQPWSQYRKNLRILALLHDLGKYRVERDSNGNVAGNAHPVISETIAKDFLNDANLLYSIRVHDKYFGFYKNFLRGKFREDKFLQTFQNADLELLRRFNYADSNSREKDSIIWFEDMAFSKGLLGEKLYLQEPQLLLNS